MKLARHRAALTHKKVVTDNWLPGIHAIAGKFLDQLGNFANFCEIQRDGHVIEAAERERDFTNIGISGALAHTIDGSLNPARPGAHRGNRAGSSHPKIVMPVKMHWDLWSNPLADLSD